MDRNEWLRRIPKVDPLLDKETVKKMGEQYGYNMVKAS